MQKALDWIGILLRHFTIEEEGFAESVRERYTLSTIQNTVGCRLYPQRLRQHGLALSHVFNYAVKALEMQAFSPEETSSAQSRKRTPNSPTGPKR